MSTHNTSPKRRDKPKQLTGRFLVCYRGVKGRHSRRWHRFLRTCGVRVIAGLYEVEHMTPRLSNRLYQEALEATSEGGLITLYPICQACERRGWRVGDLDAEQALYQADYYIY